MRKIVLLLFLVISCVVFSRTQKLRCYNVPVYGLDVPLNKNELLTTFDGNPFKTELDGDPDPFYCNYVIGDIVDNFFVVGIIGYYSDINLGVEYVPNLKPNFGISSGFIKRNMIFTFSYTTQNEYCVNLHINI